MSRDNSRAVWVRAHVLVSALLASAAIAVGLASDAVAAYKAVDPEEIAKAKVIYETRPYVSPIGEQLVAWRETGGANPRIVVRSRHGLSFGAVDELSVVGNAGLPAVAFNSVGSAYAIWPINTTSVLASAALRPPGGPFGAPLAQNTGGCASGLSVDVSKDGKLALACSTYSSTAPNYRFAYGLADELRLMSVGSFPPTGSSGDPHQRTAVDWGDNGTLAVVLKQEPTATTSEIRVVVRDPDGTTQPIQLVKSESDPRDLSLSGVVVLPNGTVAIGYTSFDYPDGFPTLHLRPPGSGPVDIPIPVGDFLRTMAADSAGRLHLLTATEDTPYSAYVLTTDSTGALGPEVTVPLPNATSYARDLLVKPDGTEIVTIHDGASRALYAAIRPAGAASFQAPVRLVSSGADNPYFALTPEGDVLATWTREVTPEDYRALVGGLDSGSRPTLNVEDLPTRVLAGVPTRFSAQARDSMGIRSLTWRFGDGGVANGEVVKHTFRGPGRYSVQVTATDRAGNATSHNAVVTVAAAEGSDRQPPRLRVNGPKKIKFAALRRKGVRFRVRSNEPARLVTQIVARPRSARISAAGELILAERAVNLLRQARNVKVKPLPRLLGRRARKLRLRVRFVATDRSGNTTVIVRPLRVGR